MNALDYFKDDPERRDVFIRTLILDIVHEEFFNFSLDNKELIKLVPSLGELLGDLNENIQNRIKKGLEDPTKDYYDNIRICSECGTPFDDGYMIGAGCEYYCSDECLHKHYTHEQFLALYAGLDENDPEEVKRAVEMSDEERNAEHEASGSECFWTQWEWRY